MAATPPTNAVPGAQLVQYPGTQPQTPQTVNLNHVAVRQQLGVATVHARALEKLDTLSGKKLEPKHAALFFENVVKKEAGSQQQNGSCMACNTPVASTGAFKFHSHILVCPLLPAQVKKGFRELRDGTDNKREAKRQVAVVQQEEAQIAAQQHAAEQKQLKQQCIRAWSRARPRGARARRRGAWVIPIIRAAAGQY